MKRKLMILAAAMLSLLAAQAGTKKATICTTYGDDIYDYELDQMIDSVVPPSAKRLIVLTQCYGGDCVDNFTGTNTAVISATSPGQKAKYGGYDDDAANACKPGAGKTGQAVHDAGVAGKHPAETPGTGGGLAPGAVSLEPVTADGPVRSRHVVVYAGMPDAKGRDNAQRDKIKANFAGQPNTTVKTVGGEGPEDGWDKHGWKRGLQEAIDEAAAAIEAAPDPSKEQFLLFVTDHGDLHTVEHVTTPAPPSNSVVVANVAAFVAADFAERQFERPGFSITVNIAPFTHAVGDDPTAYTPFFPTNAWRLLLTPPPPAAPVLLTEFEERFIEGDDGIIGNAPEEGVRLFFPVAPEGFVDSFFDITYDVEIFNDTTNVYLVMEFSQDTGPVAKGESAPGFFRITENLWIGENDMALDGHDVVVDGCTLTVDGVHVFERLLLTNSATVTHSIDSPGLVLTILEAATISAGTKIDANAKGLLPQPDSSGRSGGSYGGRGGDYFGVSGATYGDALRPVEAGSGGISGAPTRGGGRIQLTADELLLNGTLCANGGSGGGDYTSGGSGGGILLQVATVAGNGIVQANGGEPFSTGSQGGGAGGGGRIALYCDDDSAFAPQAIEAGGGYRNVVGGAGTIYLERTGTPGLLRLDNREHATSEAIPTPVACHANAFDRLEVLRGARLDLTVTQAVAYASLIVSNATMTHTGLLAGPELDVTLRGSSVLNHAVGDLNGVSIVASTVTVGAGAAIDVSGKGAGPLPETEGRSGGSYGGRGGSSYGSSAPTYGDAYWPTDLGSGGVGDGPSIGGGRIGIEAGTLVLDGELRANGQDGFMYRGGGSGGSILLNVSALSGAGVLKANGGCNGSYGGGAGGGGRVAVYAQDIQGFTPSVLETKAIAGAEWGTVFLGVPRTVAVTCTGQGACDPEGPAVIPYGETNTFAFTPVPVSLATNGTAVTPAAAFEWVNSGLWRGTAADAAWLAAINGGETIEATFEALAAGQAAALPGGGLAVTVNGLAGWRYTLERRESLTEGEWQPVPGQVEIECPASGPLLLTDAAVLPQAFYRVVSKP
jgi:hypothetical protein